MVSFGDCQIWFRSGVEVSLCFYLLIMTRTWFSFIWFCRLNTSGYFTSYGSWKFHRNRLKDSTPGALWYYSFNIEKMLKNLRKYYWKIYHASAFLFRLAWYDTKIMKNNFSKDIYNLPKEIVLHKVYSKLLGTNKQTKCMHCMMEKFSVMWLST